MTSSTTGNVVALDDLGPEARTLIEVRGHDAERFLQGLLSADLREMSPHTAKAAALLTVKGRLISELIVLSREPGTFALIVPRDACDAVYQDLDRHIIMDDVTLMVRSDISARFVWGVDDQPSADGWEFYATHHPAPGWIGLGSQASAHDTMVGLTPADAAVYHEYRVDTGSPGWGRELEADRFPPEAGFVHAVSYDKGCYRGQEPLARIHARGQVNWVLVRISGEASNIETPAPLVAETRSKAGTITTWCASSDAAGRGLAIVHRTLAVPGTVLHADDLELRVDSEPLGDDRGLAGRS